MRILLLLLAVMLLAPLAWVRQTPPPAQPPKPFDCSDPVYRQFDFWVGAWDVVPNPATLPSGTPPPGSTRSIAVRPQGCFEYVQQGSLRVLDATPRLAQVEPLRPIDFREVAVPARPHRPFH